MTRKTVADILALLMAAAVLVLGGLTVVKPAIDNWGSVWDQNPFAPQTTEETTEKEIPGKPTETTTKTTEATGAWLERALGDSGLLILRVGIVALAAFLAGAATQRVVLGDYALKVGPVEVPALTEASEDALAAIKTDLEALVARVAKLESFRRSSLQTSSNTKRSVAVIAAQVAEISRRIDDLPPRSGQQPPPPKN